MLIQIAFSGLIMLFALAVTVPNGMRNARGILVAYMVAGSFLPAAITLATGIEGYSVVHPIISGRGYKALILCSVAFAIAMYISLIVESSYRPASTLTLYRSDRRLTLIFSFTSISLGLIYLAAISFIYGGLTEAIFRLYQRTQLNDSVANYLAVLSWGSFVFAVFAYHFSVGTRGRYRIAAFASVIFFFTMSLALGGRSVVVLFGVAIFYVHLIRMPPLRFALAATVALLVIAAISYLMLNWRYEAQDAQLLRDSYQESSFSRAVTGLAFVDYVALSIEYAQIKGHDFGQLYLNTLTFPIPRDLWPEKPVPISLQMRAFRYGDVNAGLPPGLFGEAYIAFGSLGVLLSGAVLGWLIGRINVVTRIAVKTRCRLRSCTAGIIGPLIAFALVRGGLDVGVIRIGVPVFWCLVAAYLARPTRVGPGLRKFALRSRRRLPSRQIQAVIKR